MVVLEQGYCDGLWHLIVCDAAVISVSPFFVLAIVGVWRLILNTLTTIDRQTAESIAGKREERLLPRTVLNFHRPKCKRWMATESVSNAPVRWGAYEIINTNLERRYEDVAEMSDKDLCSFMGFLTDDSVFRNTKSQLVQDISSTVVRQEQERRMGLKQVGAVSLLPRLT